MTKLADDEVLHVRIHKIFLARQTRSKTCRPIIQRGCGERIVFWEIGDRYARESTRYVAS